MLSGNVKAKKYPAVLNKVGPVKPARFESISYIKIVLSGKVGLDPEFCIVGLYAWKIGRGSHCQGLQYVALQGVNSLKPRASARKLGHQIYS